MTYKFISLCLDFLKCRMAVGKFFSSGGLTFTSNFCFIFLCLKIFPINMQSCGCAAVYFYLMFQETFISIEFSTNIYCELGHVCTT